MQGKPKLFISHITEEAALADIFQRHLRRDFLGLIDVFVSSDHQSIQLGARWLNDIDDALIGAKVELVVCSHESVKRPWINFEAGAGWARKIPVVPICHSGMRKTDLPLPLNMLQAMLATDTSDLKQLYELVARQLESEVPNPDLTQVVKEVEEFEHEYNAFMVVRTAVRALISILPNLQKIFLPNPAAKWIEGPVTDWRFAQMRSHLDALQKANMIQYVKGDKHPVGSEGSAIDVKIQVMDSYYEIAEKVMA